MSDTKLNNLAFELFKIFAQYESSLKELGYFQSNSRGQIIVDWDKFVNEKIGADFFELLSTKSSSAKYILEYPPMRQAVNEHNQIIWEEVSNNEKNVQTLFGHISRIRNNLFHGAKFNGTWFDPERSQLLMEHALVVLRHFKGTLADEYR